MREEKLYDIQFSGLKNGKHEFDYQIDGSFFNLFDYDEFEDADIAVKAVLDKRLTIMELPLSHQGTVKVPCDVTNEIFDLPVEGELNLIVKFGEEFNDEHDEMLILPHGAYEFNIAQYIYELIVLSVPQKRVHPSVEVLNDDEDDWDDDEWLDIDDDIEEDDEKESEDNKEIDPRWDKLKKLLTDKN